MPSHSHLHIGPSNQAVPMAANRVTPLPKLQINKVALCAANASFMGPIIYLQDCYPSENTAAPLLNSSITVTTNDAIGQP